jgi:RsiW-degrading membrane proteinase PrsW (M82 family)
MGFAWAENFFYIIVHYEGNLIWSLLRVFIFSLGHGLYTVYMGWALGRAKVKNGYVTLGDLRLGLVMAIVAHAIYNSDLIQVDSYSSLGLWVVMTLGVFTLILYALVRNSWAEEKKWHYDDGYAPKGRARAS